MEQKNDSLEINETFFTRFFSWCKKHGFVMGIITTFGVILSGLQTYKSFTEPDIAEEIANTISSAIQEYSALEPIAIPDSLKSNPEVVCLTNYQKEFEKYRCHLQLLDFSSVKDEELGLRLAVYKSRCDAYNGYTKQCEIMDQRVLTLFCFVRDSNRTSPLGVTINEGIILKLIDLRKEVANDDNLTANTLTSFLKKDLANLTKKEKKYLYGNIEKSTHSSKKLDLITTQTSFYKSVYIAANIRLLEIVNG